jgi:prophage antirepressor-like protein
MTITIGGIEHHIKLSGTIADPYFCGKDVCNVLGYKDSKDALQKIDRDDKQPLHDLRSDPPNKLEGSVPPICWDRLNH